MVTVGFLLLIIVVIIGLQISRSRPIKAAWNQVSERLGFHLEHQLTLLGRPTATFEMGGLPGSFLISSGRPGPVTVVEIGLAQPPPAQVTVARRGQVISPHNPPCQTGDPTFDEHFEVACPSSDRLHDVLDEKTRAIFLEHQDLFQDTQLEITDHSVRATVSYVLVDAGRLSDLLTLVKKVANRLNQSRE